MDDETVVLITNIVAWTLVTFWLFVWTGFLSSIVIARFWISHEEKQHSSEQLVSEKSPLANGKIANGKVQNGKVTNGKVVANGKILALPAFSGVSILKPLTGSGETLSHNLESWFNLRYPIFELLFCVHNVDDPAVPVVNALIDKYPGVDAKLVISGGSIDDIEKHENLSGKYIHYPNVADLATVVNPKIRNLLPAYESAKHDLLFISDCNIEAEPTTLHDVVRLMGPRVGTVCQMHFVRDPQPEAMSLGFMVNKVFFGTQNAKCILFLALLRITSTVSAAMLVRKSALDECGGLRAFGCYLAEDVHIGYALAKRGRVHKLGSRLAWQNPSQPSVNDLFSRIIRWKRLRHTVCPPLVLIDPLSECFIGGLAASWALCYLFPALDYWPTFLAHCLAWVIADFLLLKAINKEPLKFSFHSFLTAWLVRELSAPVLHLASLTTRRVSWRGQEYFLHFGGVTDRVTPSQAKPPSKTADLLLSRRLVTSLTLGILLLGGALLK